LLNPNRAEVSPFVALPGPPCSAHPGRGDLSSHLIGDKIMRAATLPEDRTEIEVERTIVRNRLVRELCLHEIRLADAMAHEDGREDATPADYHAATCSTHKARQLINAMFSE